VHRILGPFFIPFLRLEYYLSAWLELIGYWLTGKGWYTRLRALSGSWPVKPYPIRRLAIFAAFHGTEVPLSNISYLKCLREAGFEILYLHNGKVSSTAIETLKPLCISVIERPNLGQDWGSYKDGFLNLRRAGWLENLEWLLFCNDSVHFLGDEYGSAFAHRLNEHLCTIDEPILALNENLQLWQHLQSFFVAVKPEVFNSKKFISFWQDYLPLSHRYHAINKGEVRWSLRVLNEYRKKVLYSPSALYDYASKEFENEHWLGVSRLLIPKSCGSIVDGLRSHLAEDINSDEDRKKQPRSGGRFTTNYMYWDQMMALMGILESTNTSHSCALMYCALLGSPFLKKDICRHNTYTLSQIKQFLEFHFLYGNQKNCENHLLLYNEILSSFLSQGTLVSYLFRPRISFRKGLMYRGFGISQESLPNYGNR
jgi:hypothetical protein